LYAGLQRATTQFSSETQDGGRGSVIAALEVVLRFLQKSDEMSSHGLITPLARLHSDLEALDDGNVSALLAPKKRPGRARASGLYDGLKGLAVFTVQALTRWMDRVDARKAVARKLNELGVSPARKGSKDTSKGITERTLRSWQEDIDADIGLRTTAARTFGDLQAEFQKANFTAVELLDRLSVYVKATRGAETT
jgi:hypothetical protein